MQMFLCIVVYVCVFFSCLCLVCDTRGFCVVFVQFWNETLRKHRRSTRRKTTYLSSSESWNAEKARSQTCTFSCVPLTGLVVHVRMPDRGNETGQEMERVNVCECAHVSVFIACMCETLEKKKTIRFTYRCL